jgi:hypothetical protein
VLVAVAAMTALAQRTRAPARGELIGAQGRPIDLWHAAVDPWSGAGLGSAQAPSPAAVVRAAAAALLWPVAGDQAAARVVDLALLGAPMLAAVSAYLAAGRIARSRWLRSWAALTWATVPLLTGAVDQGRLGPVAAYVLLPVVARAAAGALGGSVRSACAAALGVVLVGAAVPALLVPAALVAVGGVLLCRGLGRACSAMLLLLAAALIGPWLGTLADDPRQLLAGPGALVSGGASAPVEALANLVSTPGWPTWTVGLVAAPLLLAGLAGLLRNGPHARALLATWSIGLLGVAGALAAPLVTVTRTAEGPLRPWSGTGLLLVVLAAVSGALVAADGLRDRLARHGFGWRQLLVGPVAAAAALAPLVAAATWAWPGRPVPAKAAATSGPVLPAVALDAAQGPAALRTLVISGHQGEISYRLVGAEPGSWSRDLPPELAAVTTDPVTAAVQALAAPPAGDGDAVTPSLRRLAIGFVIVDRTTPASVAARLDSAADLARLGSYHPPD